MDITRGTEIFLSRGLQRDLFDTAMARKLNDWINLKGAANEKKVVFLEKKRKSCLFAEKCEQEYRRNKGHRETVPISGIVHRRSQREISKWNG